MLRCMAMIPSLTWLFVYHKFLINVVQWVLTQIFIDVIRRYLTSVVNLVHIRVVLLLLGFLEFENSSYKFFERTSYDTAEVES